MEQAREALLVYIRALDVARETTNKPEERVAYTKHLAEAARIAAALELGAAEPLVTLVQTEQRSHGWNYLAGDHGDRASAAFGAFCRLVPGSMTAPHSGKS